MTNECKVLAQKVSPTHSVITDVPGDKSISHRAIILGSLTEQVLDFENFLMSEDCINTIKIFREMGVEIDVDGLCVRLNGVGLRGLKAPKVPLDVGNSGTSIRLLIGLLSAQSFESTLTGDESIQKRPMGRVIHPLTLMGAHITSTERVETVLDESGKRNVMRSYAPVTIYGNVQIHGTSYLMPIASAQLKSSLLLAALYIRDELILEEPAECRDHTERLLAYFGADISTSNGRISLSGGRDLQSPKTSLTIPSDVSSAMFFVVLGLLLPESQITLTGIGLNPTRTRALAVLKDMGAIIDIDNELDELEPSGDLIVSSSFLRNLSVSETVVPNLIDEIPILSVAALFGSGEFVIRDAEELRVKESDRISAIVRLVEACGCEIQEFEDGFLLEGGQSVQPFTYDCMGDHRMAMSAIVLAISAGVEATVLGCESIQTSFPNFFEILQSLDISFTLS